VNRGLSLGISWSFGQGGGEPLIAARQRSLVLGLCEKSGS